MSKLAKNKPMKTKYEKAHDLLGKIRFELKERLSENALPRFRTHIQKKNKKVLVDGSAYYIDLKRLNKDERAGDISYWTQYGPKEGHGATPGHYFRRWLVLEANQREDSALVETFDALRDIRKFLKKATENDWKPLFARLFQKYTEKTEQTDFSGTMPRKALNLRSSYQKKWLSMWEYCML